MRLSLREERETLGEKKRKEDLKGWGRKEETEENEKKKKFFSFSSFARLDQWYVRPSCMLLDTM